MKTIEVCHGEIPALASKKYIDPNYQMYVEKYGADRVLFPQTYDHAFDQSAKVYYIIYDKETSVHRLSYERDDERQRVHYNGSVILLCKDNLLDWKNCEPTYTKQNNGDIKWSKLKINIGLRTFTLKQGICVCVCLFSCRMIFELLFNCNECNTFWFVLVIIKEGLLLTIHKSKQVDTKKKVTLMSMIKKVVYG